MSRLFAEYITRNAGLEEAQAEIKIIRRNINNLRYADDTTVYSLSSEPPGKPMNTGVDSLTFLQGIFPTQEMNQGLLHCRRMLYQLSYQGSPV